MRWQHLQTERPQYYDRIQTNITQGYKADGIAPHGTTQRTSYTVPAGKLGYCDFIYGVLLRDSAPGSEGTARITFVYTPSGGGSTDMMTVMFKDPNVGYTQHDGAGPFGFMQAGDVLEIKTVDQSTGGTIHYQSVFKVAEMAR